MKTVLDNPDICQGAILSAPALHVDPNVVGGPFKVSSTSSAMNASFDLALKILLTVTYPCPYINFCIHVPFLTQLLATKLDKSGTNHSKLRPRNSLFGGSKLLLPSSRPGSKTNFVVAKLYVHFYAEVVSGCVDDRITNIT